MSFKTQMVSDLSVFFETDEFAESVTYTPYSGSAQTIDAIVQYGPDEAEKASMVYDIVKVRVKASDVSQPVYMDKITLSNGENWFAQQWTYGVNQTWEIICTSEERPKMP